MGIDPSCQDPTPDPGIGNNHGTMCAGLIGMGKNSHCGIGVAYNSKIGGTYVCVFVYLPNGETELCTC